MKEKMKEKNIKLGRENWQVTGSEKAAYIAGRVGIFGEQSLVPGMMNTFLIFNGVDLKSVAVFTLIVKNIDAMDDLLFGYLVDKINLKKNKLFAKIGGEGRYIPWLRCLIWFFPFAVTRDDMAKAVTDAGYIYIMTDKEATRLRRNLRNNAITATLTERGSERIQSRYQCRRRDSF